MTKPTINKKLSIPNREYRLHSSPNLVSNRPNATLELALLHKFTIIAKIIIKKKPTTIQSASNRDYIYAISALSRWQVRVTALLNSIKMFNVLPPLSSMHLTQDVSVRVDSIKATIDVNHRCQLLFLL